MIHQNRISRALGGDELAEDGSSAISFIPFLAACLLFLSFFVEIGTYIYINAAADNAAFVATHQLMQDTNTTSTELKTLIAENYPMLDADGIYLDRAVTEIDSSTDQDHKDPLTYYTHHLPAQKVIDSGKWEERKYSNTPYKLCSVQVNYIYMPRTALGYALSGAVGKKIEVIAGYVGIADTTLVENPDTVGVARW